MLTTLLVAVTGTGKRMIAQAAPHTVMLRTVLLGMGFFALTGTASVHAACLESGGSDSCFSPGYSYSLCDYQGAFCSHAVAWCKAYGGVWSGSCQGNSTCPGLIPLSENNLSGTSVRFFLIDKQAEGCPYTDSDSSWGASWVDNAICWTVGPEYKNGIEIRNARIFDYSGAVYPAPSSCRTPVQLKNIARRDRNTSCPSWATAITENGVTQCVRKNDTTCPVGNPAQPGTGNKHLVETDIPALGEGSLSFTRTYNSFGFFSPPAYAGTAQGMLGSYWRTTYDRQVFPVSGSSYVSAIAWRSDGSLKHFAANGEELEHLRGPRERLEALTSNNQVTGWQYTTSNDDIESYDAQGRLLSITTRNGYQQTLTYGANGLLASVQDSFGRTWQFLYKQGLLSAIQDSSGNLYLYEFDTAGRLSSVLFPDGKMREYSYGQNTLATSLTEIYDENGAVYARYTYDPATLQLKTSVLAPNLAQGTINKYSFTYQSATSVVTSPLGQAVTYSFANVGGALRTVSTSDQCAACGVSNKSQTYDANGYPSSSTDFNGTVTEYSYNNRGLETQRIEAKSTPTNPNPPQKRTIQTDWHASFRVPTERRTYAANSTLVSKTQWVYNNRGQETARCESDPTLAVNDACSPSGTSPTGVRRWTSTYCETPDIAAGLCPQQGLLLQTDGPRTDVADITTYLYRVSDDPTCASNGACSYRKGDRWKVTNALGQVTETVSMDKNGRVTRLKDVNGTLTDLSYHSRGWLLSRTVRANADGSPSAQDATTRFTYDGVGNVTRVTQPDGAYLSYTYDEAHRLTDIADNLNSRIHYTLDAAGNRLKEDTFDLSNSLTRTLSRTYDSLSRLKTTLDAYQHSTGFDYDAQGSLTSTTDALGIQTTQQYDPLGRLLAALQNANGSGTTANTTTQYGYDAKDQLTRVTDPEGLTTQYTVDGLNNSMQLQSPDTGTSAFTYDAAGNRKTQTDARGITTRYTFDALNRLTQITYPTASLNITYQYDQPNNTTGCNVSYPIGRLTRMTDESGTTTYCYDRRGNLTQKVHMEQNHSFETNYTYTLADRVSAITYPSGASVSYSRDSVGRISGASVTSPGGNITPIITTIAYVPFGPASSYTFAQGNQTLVKTADANYAITDVVSNALNLHFRRDALGNIDRLGTQPNANPPLEQYAYDPLQRLAKVNDDNQLLIEGYTYNLTGDRVSKQQTGQSLQSYTYTTATHRLASINGQSRQLDAAGNTIQLPQGNATLALAYDDRNRLSQLARNGIPTASYRYNGKGERIYKATAYPQPDYRWFSYDEAGHLLGEYHSTGSRDVVWIDQTPVALLDTTGVSYPAADQLFSDGFDPPPVPTTTIYYIHTDQLDTPRAVTTTAGTKVWSWDWQSNPFGETAPKEDADGDGNRFILNLRFAGQYADAETKLYYNMNRYYEAGVGRYDQSDPIGLKGGVNTYGYVGSNPLRWADPNGLYSIEPGCNSYGFTSCDGNGNWKTKNCNKGCSKKCTQAHEDVHFLDYTSRYGMGSCRNRPPNWVPSDQEVMPAAYGPANNDQFRIWSECRAQCAGLKCVEKLKHSDCCDDEDDIEEYKAKTKRFLEKNQCAQRGVLCQ